MGRFRWRWLGDNSSDGATLPDKFPNNPAAANDTDNDGYPNNWTELDNGTNRDGLVLDNCPDVYGNSTSSAVGENVVPYYGCIDTDGDGREDSTDAFPADPTQVADSDGDGWGDNQLGNDPDACPYVFGFINGTKQDGTSGSVVQSKVKKKTKTKTEFPMKWIIVQILLSVKV